MRPPALDDIEQMQFEAAARLLREGVQQLRPPVRRRDRVVFEELLGALERRLPARPERPTAVEPPPRPPDKPEPPAVAKPKYVPSASYLKEEAHLQRQISALASQPHSPPDRSRRDRRLNVLKSKKKEALERIRKADQSQDTTFLAWRVHNEWKMERNEIERRHRGLVADIARANEDALERWKAAVAEWHKQHGIRHRMVANLRQDLGAVLAGRPIGVPIEKAKWRFFPASALGREQVLTAFRDAQKRRPAVKYDVQRLLFAYGRNQGCCRMNV